MFQTLIIGTCYILALLTGGANLYARYWLPLPKLEDDGKTYKLL